MSSGSIRTLANNLPNLKIFHLPKLHAKVYIADSKKAIITSANLTRGGLNQNYEYGLFTDSFRLISQIREDIIEYSKLGALVTVENLLEYCKFF